MFSIQQHAIRTDNVVESSAATPQMWIIRRTIHMVFAILALMAMLAVGCVGISPTAVADPSNSSSSSPTSSDSSTSSSDSGDSSAIASIADPDNLLGDNLGEVTDAIQSTKEETGVTVRLQFLPKFMEGEDPSTWASNVLKSQDPPVNTVMLFVASQDGNLVVAVSPNSDEWLRNQNTVKALSDAAVKPLTEGDGYDWSGSAIAMMNAIKEQKKSATSTKTSTIGVVVFAIALGVLVIAASVFAVRHHGRKHKESRQLARRERRRAARKADKSDGATPDEEPDNQDDDASNAEDADDIDDANAVIDVDKTDESSTKD